MQDWSANQNAPNSKGNRMQASSPSTQTSASEDAPIHDRPSQDIEDFIYLISHDVRSSVRALLELPQWIAEDLEEAGFKVDGQVASSIELMNRHTGRLDRMLVDLLTFSRIGRMQSVRLVDLEAAIDEVMEEIKLPAGFTLMRALECDQMLIGERDILTLLNALITNAIKHHDKPSGRIVVASRRAGTEVIISVCDDGPGIQEKFHNRIFGPMTTLRPRDEVEGSGMGLANVNKIATLYGGSVKVLSSPFGPGTNVEARLACDVLIAKI
jgi:signal transduction histidine kinase